MCFSVMCLEQLVSGTCGRKPLRYASDSGAGSACAAFLAAGQLLNVFVWREAPADPGAEKTLILCKYLGGGSAEVAERWS